MLASYTFIPIFAPAITLYKATANGLVAQLNSASDYGSEGYWFESSRGHKFAKWRQLKTIGAIFLYPLL
jgi:hypothetical protein